MFLLLLILRVTRQVGAMALSTNHIRNVNLSKNPRTQTHLFPVSLDQSIDPDNEVRLIDLFVESLPLIKFGFRMDFIENGRPAYHPSDLLKLFIYGYLNRIRSSRALEKECGRNIELMWFDQYLGSVK